MDAYEATKVLFSRIQALDPEHASKIMGLLLIQDHGEKEMVWLAFGPDALLHSVLSKARGDLGLPPLPVMLPRQNSAPRALSPLSISSPQAWPPASAAAAAAQPFSRSNEVLAPAGEELPNGGADELVSSANGAPHGSPFLGSAGEAFVDEFFLGDGECRSPGGAGGGVFSYGGWANGHHRRCSSVSDVSLGGDPFGWKPCLYFARGYCKNGSSCRFVHGLPDDAAAAAAVEQQCQNLLLRSKSQHLAAASSFPYMPTGSLPASPTGAGKAFNLIQLQQSETQRNAAAEAAALALGADDAYTFLGRTRLERAAEIAAMLNPSARQIYLTFPADSTFREEDVSNYFSIYGPVQDVRIPYQQKRMFGFVTFVYPETVKTILAKGNPHFICDARVLVKPYKEKGKVPEKFRSRGDFSGCNSPTGLLDHRDPFDLHQLSSRMLHSNGGTRASCELLLRRKLEEQQQASELQQAIELQSRRLMNLQLLDFMGRSSPILSPVAKAFVSTPANSTTVVEPPPEWAGETLKFGVIAPQKKSSAAGTEADEKELSADGSSPNRDPDLHDSGLEHNLPDSPFASPTKSERAGDAFGLADQVTGNNCLSNFHHHAATTGGRVHHHHLGLASTFLPPPVAGVDFDVSKSYFLPMSRLSSDPGAIGM